MMINLANTVEKVVEEFNHVAQVDSASRIEYIENKIREIAGTKMMH
jgi:hypothetical protein